MFTVSCDIMINADTPKAAVDCDEKFKCHWKDLLKPHDRNGVRLYVGHFINTHYSIHIEDID